MKTSIKSYPALNGDSFMIRSEAFTLLIDGGYVNTYEKYLRKELANESLTHLIVTHIDQDHISGVVKLLEENLTSREVSVHNVWHNSYRHLQPNKRVPFGSPRNAQLEELKGGSYLREIIEGEKSISAMQGSSLAALILEGGYTWNKEFDGGPVCVDAGREVQLTENVCLKLLSPSKAKLDQLERAWLKELRKNGFFEELPEDTWLDDAFEFFCAKKKERKRVREQIIASGEIDIDSLLRIPFIEDTSPANGSSIAFVLESGAKRFLFLGDAHPGLIVYELQKLYSKGPYPVHFDLIKLSHHGSFANNSPELFEYIDSENFLISTNGRGHGHPDMETLAHIVSRPTRSKRYLYFNYPVPGAKAFDNDALKVAYNYEIVLGNGDEPLNLNFSDE